jgi:hypothetical protein
VFESMAATYQAPSRRQAPNHIWGQPFRLFTHQAKQLR